MANVLKIKSYVVIINNFRNYNVVKGKVEAIKRDTVNIFSLNFLNKDNIKIKNFLKEEINMDKAKKDKNKAMEVNRNKKAEVLNKASLKEDVDKGFFQKANYEDKEEIKDSRESKLYVVVNFIKKVEGILDKKDVNIRLLKVDFENKDNI